MLYVGLPCSRRGASCAVRHDNPNCMCFPMVDCLAKLVVRVGRWPWWQWVIVAWAQRVPFWLVRPFPYSGPPRFALLIVYRQSIVQSMPIAYQTKWLLKKLYHNIIIIRNWLLSSTVCRTALEMASIVYSVAVVAIFSTIWFSAPG